LAQGAGRALCVQEVVNSPTFTMLNEYDSGRIPFYHLDLYRLTENIAAPAAQQPAVDMLIQELHEVIAGDGLVLIEWPEALSAFLKAQDFVNVDLDYCGDMLGNNQGLPACEPPEQAQTGRQALITAHGCASSKIVEALRNVYFS
jgi:tRNA threonylcarbamoyl adenosine modification protein YjeE